MKKQNVREIALDLLIRINRDGSFSHLIISDAILKSNLEANDEGLLTEIVYGTVERSITLDYYLAPFIKSQKKLQDWVIQLLKMSLYQMTYLEKVPEYAVLNEAVNIAKKRGHKGIASLVNGVLRTIQRKGLADIDALEDEVQKLALKTSHPTWLVERWIDAYGFDTAVNMCETNTLRKPMSVRVNALKATREDVIEKLANAGIKATLSNHSNHAILIEEGNIFQTDLLKEGYITVQDTSSMIAVDFLDVKEDMVVLDSCSAPGGKTTYIAERMNNTGDVHAYDLHQNKIKLIKANASRLGLTNIEADALDARKLSERYNNNTFDRIIVDAPCSGFGVIRSKPDVKYNKDLNDIEKLQSVQYDILQSVAPLVKQNGKLVYSTCTVEVMENEEVVRLFLDNHNNFEVDEAFLKEAHGLYKDLAKVTAYGLQLFPQSLNSDGFFVTRMKKK